MDKQSLKKITKERKITFKFRKWLDEYIKTGNATEAAARSYDCNTREVAKTIGWENLSKLDFGELLEVRGVTDNQLAKKVDEGLKAKKLLADAVEYPDHGVRHKYLETALKLKKRLIDKPDVAIAGENVQVIFHTSLKQDG